LLLLFGEAFLSLAGAVLGRRKEKRESREFRDDVFFLFL
jgi:hypothetical protein